MTEIIQSDRDFAADYLSSIGQDGSAKLCREGKGFRLTAEAFANYREFLWGLED